jgi:hypothetical protein
MFLVLAVPDPVAVSVVLALVQRGHEVAVVAPQHFSSTFPDSVTFFPGDSASIDFGLSGSDYTRLLRDVERVYLAHGGLGSGGDVEKSRAVRQAAEVRDFVRAGGARGGVVHLSSLLVFGNARGPVDESDFVVGQSFADEQEEALAVAERIIRSISTDRTTAILRSAPVVGSEIEGTLLDGGPLSQLVRAVDKAGDDRGFAFSDLPTRWDTVERVARVLVSLPLDGKTFHLVDADPLTDRELVLWIADHLHKPIAESAAGARPLLGRQRPSYPGSRALGGWGLHFERQNAVAAFGSLLDRDEAAVLEKLFSGAGPSHE